MEHRRNNDRGRRPNTGSQVAQQLRRSVAKGRDWPMALLETMGAWPFPQETYRGRRYHYFIGGEAFDWLALAERLCRSIDGLIPQQEKEELLLRGRLPGWFDESRFRDLLGPDKYRGYLNYFYGVTVEEALQLAVEGEARKRHLSNSNRYYRDFSEEAFERIYGAPKGELLRIFREEKGYRSKASMSVAEHREFTYWLFKYRLKACDGARVASDTRKGLKQLQRMAFTHRT